MNQDNRMLVITGTGMLIIGTIGALIFRDVTLFGLGGAVFVVTVATARGWLKG